MITDKENQLNLEKAPTVSVLMSVYNEPLDWVKLSIDSILTQTFTDFEFIIINDKPDRPENERILHEFAERDDRIVLITNEENLGLPKSLNKGIRIAKGKYIARMDADDISLKNRFKYQVEFMNNHPEVGVCGTEAKKIDGKNKIIGSYNIIKRGGDLRNSIFFFCPFIHPTVMIRKEILTENHYDENCRIAQDWNLWLRLIDKTEFANIRKKLLYYRISSKQSEFKAGPEKSKASKRYSDSIFAEKLSLPPTIKELFIKIRGGEVEQAELDLVFSHILDSPLKNQIKAYALSSYLRYLPQKDLKNLWSNKVIKSHIPILYRSLINELKRYYE